jgi:hypothetical protein
VDGDRESQRHPIIELWIQSPKVSSKSPSKSSWFDERVECEGEVLLTVAGLGWLAGVLFRAICEPPGGGLAAVVPVHEIGRRRLLGQTSELRQLRCDIYLRLRVAMSLFGVRSGVLEDVFLHLLEEPLELLNLPGSTDFR